MSSWPRWNVWAEVCVSRLGTNSGRKISAPSLQRYWKCSTKMGWSKICSGPEEASGGLKGGRMARGSGTNNPPGEGREHLLIFRLSCYSGEISVEKWTQFIAMHNKKKVIFGAQILGITSRLRGGEAVNSSETPHWSRHSWWLIGSRECWGIWKTHLLSLQLFVSSTSNCTFVLKTLASVYLCVQTCIVRLVPICLCFFNFGS